MLTNRKGITKMRRWVTLNWGYPFLPNKNLRKGWQQEAGCFKRCRWLTGSTRDPDGSVCEHTYVVNHWHPARPLCSCRMGTFVWRWNSFYACQWMTVKAEKAWRKQAYLSSSCSKVRTCKKWGIKKFFNFLF